MTTFSLSKVTPHAVAKMFPVTPGKNIRAHLPAVLAALEEFNLADRDMVLMALATIRAETEGFEPISEPTHKYNTAPGGVPYAKYETGRLRTILGNVAPGDGALFKGRGFIQLTGRDNYRRIGAKLGVDLIATPELANEPQTAARILACFLKAKETKIRVALAKDDLASARKLVNGGSHGLMRFTDAFRKGQGIFGG